MDNILLKVKHLEKRYTLADKPGMIALKDISFQIDQGEFVSLVGPSGCGKTSLLMCVDGLMEPSSGEVLLNGKVVRKPPSEMVLVFQNYSNSRAMTFPARHAPPRGLRLACRTAASPSRSRAPSSCHPADTDRRADACCLRPRAGAVLPGTGGCEFSRGRCQR